MVSSQARRDQVALAMGRGHSQRQACELIEMPRSMLKYRSVRAERRHRSVDSPNQLLEWLSEAKIDTALIDPGKPWQNGADESFNGKFRDQCLSMEWFRSRTEARVLIQISRRHYNDVRPHSSLDYRTPNEFRHHHESTHQGAILK